MSDTHPQADAPTWPWPVPREVPDAHSWGCPATSQLPCCWLEQWDGPWLVRPVMYLKKSTYCEEISGGCKPSF